MLEIDPEFSGAYYLIGDCHRFKVEPEAALHNFLIALEHYKQGDFEDEKNWTEFLVGEIYCIDKHNYLKGFPYLQKGFDEKDVSRYGYWGHLSWIFRLIGDYDRAKIYSEKMLEISPESIWWFVRLYGNILNYQGRFEESIHFLDSICSITVGTEYLCARFLFHTNIYLEHYNEAELYFNQYLDEGIVWESDSVLIAFAYKKLGREHESDTILKSVLTSLEKKLLHTQPSYIFRTLALLHAIQNEKEESLKYLSALLEMGQGTTWFHLAERNPIFKDLWDDPEFKAIVKRNNEKLEKVQAQINEMREKGEISF
jgi:tetratricopeptide (TPR) repeat protein